MNNDLPANDVNRRDFIKGGSIASILTMMGGVALNFPKSSAAEPEAKKPTNPPLPCGVIGCGPWGREIIQTLGRLPNAPVVAVCDNYEAMVNRAKREAPEAAAYSDYKELLADKKVLAVFIATPTHTHKQIALDALKAGKSVYCEAPYAHTIDDAKAIAQAALNNPKNYFQAGLQLRSDPELVNIQNFISAGAMGTALKARSQYHKKESWRKPAANDDRAKALNWRLDPDRSAGIVSEQGIHQLDQARWMLKKRIRAISGFGSLVHWNDGREMPDTIQAILDFAGGARLNYEATLGNSFDATYDMFYGTDAAIMLRDRKAWMFKEVDAALLGWEVYARKENFYKETGIVLAANATKLVAQGESGKSALLYDFSSLYYALEAFVNNAYVHATAVKEFTETFGDSADAAALSEYLVELNKQKMPAADAKTGFEATVLGIKANEAIVSNSRVKIEEDLFKLV